MPSICQPSNFSQLKAHDEQLERLGMLAERYSLLAKAFRGELVPQDPTDEAASVLLARIRAQRNADTASQPKRGRGRKVLAL